MTATPAGIGLVRPIARAVQARFRGLTDLSELMQRGALGLLLALPGLDVKRDEASRQAYLRLRVYGAMLDPIRAELRRHEVSCETLPESAVPAKPCKLEGLLEHLPPRQAELLRLRAQGYTQQEAAVAFQISQSRVSRLEARAVRTLRERLAA